MRESVEIYQWQNYQVYTPKEQINLQKKSFTELSLHISPGVPLNFIYSTRIESLHAAVLNMLKDIRVTDTQTVLEDEIYYTTKLEGANTTHIRTTELHLGGEVRNDDYSEHMVKNAFEATKLLNLYGNRISEDMLIDVWNTLTKNACENTEIRGERYRTDDVWIGNYKPVNAKEVPQLMKRFIQFYNSKELTDIPLVKAIILHYAFEAIHPFCDGNGRLGRMLLNNYLILNGFDAVKAMSFSMAINQNRGLYDNAFVKSENIYNDCTPMIEYFLELMADECVKVLKKQGIMGEGDDEHNNDDYDRER